MFPEIQKYFLFMIAISIIGWMMEVACKSLEYGRYINRGFLIGPWCPIYGVGAVLIVRGLSGYADSPAAVFLLGMVLCGTLEYITSWLLEKIFHARWWDYSHKPFNLNGRICANTLIPFGLLGLVLVYFIQPLLFSLFDRLPTTALNILSAALLALFLADAVISVHVLVKICKTAGVTGADDTEMLTRMVRDELGRRSALARRALRAFPGLRLYNGKLLEQMRERQREIKRETAERRRRIRRELDGFEQRLKAYGTEKRKRK